ncbi:hypothetical protein GGTG_00662 [Gaeumannomyces tritici R3-111a-1]|uniref:Uncharacterized protein n=1 Tax=Gaeumannomyces tritici (strain R3-111a-1) TaxID=644352 RepID=J3NHC5_GAET3|nr:hypothetical protein GGTG_00662 [Gaeumannomyces tritici R3-111a-1]EJT80668.1 hypothetical protein GGTG_00662 [Gaeumannomyces tritici R3-111a-1]
MSRADFEPERIWGDDAETTVFAQGYGLGHTAMFSFTLDPSKPPTAMLNRICTRFHALETSTEAGTFPNADIMRQALWKAVEVVWLQCLAGPRIDDVGAMVDSHDDTWVESATRVRFRDGPTGLHVFKGMDFRAYLTHCDDEGDKNARHMIDC